VVPGVAPVPGRQKTTNSRPDPVFALQFPDLMLALANHRFARLFALALVVWLSSDAVLYRACSHDPVAYAQAGRSDVGSTSSTHHRTNDRDDANRCSCHWQYIPVPAPLPTQVLASAPIVCTLALSTPQDVARTLERPPQG
jgi:hypothetical protein